MNVNKVRLLKAYSINQIKDIVSQKCLMRVLGLLVS